MLNVFPMVTIRKHLAIRVKGNEKGVKMVDYKKSTQKTAVMKKIREKKV